MINFQLKLKPIFIAFLIIGLLLQLLWYLSTTTNNAEAAKAGKKQDKAESATYIEKIDNFTLQVFNTNQKLSHFVQAKQYLNFKTMPGLLLQPKVTIYNQQGIKHYQLTARHAHYLNNGDIRFQGKVTLLNHSGVRHKMHTEELLVTTNTHDLFSDKKVQYFGEMARIESLGLQSQGNNDNLLLTGKTTIHQKNGQLILTRDLRVDQLQGQKRYHSAHATQYQGMGNTIDASQGINMDMAKHSLQLLGKVHIVQNTESNIQSNRMRIKTSNLTIDQSNGAEIYRTKEAIHYQKGITDIRATGMEYDAKNQTIKLAGRVKAQYE